MVAKWKVFLNIKTSIYEVCNFLANEHFFVSFFFFFFFFLQILILVSDSHYFLILL